MANESVGLMIMQTLRHLHSSPRHLHLRRNYRLSLSSFLWRIISFDGIIGFDGIVDIIYNLLSDASARQLTFVACRDLQRDVAYLKSCGDSP
jgi:hypothetical protein